jgi:hypothetical protein
MGWGYYALYILNCVRVRKKLVFVGNRSDINIEIPSPSLSSAPVCFALTRWQHVWEDWKLVNK